MTFLKGTLKIGVAYVTVAGLLAITAPRIVDYLNERCAARLAHMMSLLACSVHAERGGHRIDVCR